MTAMASLLPPERLNAELRDHDAWRVHTNLRSYENGIRWNFHRLKAES